MDTVDPARFLFASFVVLGLLALFAFVLKNMAQKPLMQRLFAGKLPSNTQSSERLSIVEMKPIDYKTKLVLVRRDDVEHLIVIADGKLTIVETGIKTHA